MYCPKCGKKNEGDIKFCIFCGYKFEKEQGSLNLNYYEILEITQDASQEVIKAAYKALVKKFHPDNINRKRDENRTIEEINMAYEVLSNPECIFRKNRALAPHERSAVPLGTDHCPVG